MEMNIFEAFENLKSSFERMYPEQEHRWCECVEESGERCGNAVRDLVIMYVLQNELIHEAAMQQNPSMALAERELYWIRTGGPEEFFAGMSCVFSESYRDTLGVAWNLFQSLLCGTCHAELMWLTRGHIPEEIELGSDDAMAQWAGRLRLRFAPIFEVEAAEVV
jgi:hypothetical protein